MKKEILAIPISLLLFLVPFSGCVEETTQVDDQHPVEKPKMVYIDDNYDNTISGWGYDHFDSVQDGINKILENGTVYVSNGIYYENIVINKSINLVGNDKVSTIIDGGKKWEVFKITSDNCTIKNINISNSGSDAGVKILSNRNTLTNNILYGNHYGIWIDTQSDNIISNNIISNNKNGIKLFGALNSIITANQISSNSDGGIILDSSNNVTVTDNVFQNNGIIILGALFAWNTHVIKNNTANDKYIYYYKNETGITVPNDAFQVILANCSDFEIKNNNFENIMIGVLIGYSSNVRIESNTFQSNNQSAIKLYSSDNNTIISNTINGGDGIDLSKSDDNIIWQNTIGNTTFSIRMSRSNYNDISSNNLFSSSDYGIYFQFTSNNNVISRNKIYDNDVGIRLKGSKFNNVFKNEFNNNSNKGLYICCGAEDNIIYSNSFIKNKEHVDYTISNVNYFYKDGFGNYWDDYLERYPNATQLNGVWDTSYEIPGRSFEDKYPLVKPVDI